LNPGMLEIPDPAVFLIQTAPARSGLGAPLTCLFPAYAPPLSAFAIPRLAIRTLVDRNCHAQICQAWVVRGFGHLRHHRRGKPGPFLLRCGTGLPFFRIWGRAGQISGTLVILPGFCPPQFLNRAGQDRLLRPGRFDIFQVLSPHAGGRPTFPSFISPLVSHVLGVAISTVALNWGGSFAVGYPARAKAGCLRTLLPPGTSIKKGSRTPWSARKTVYCLSLPRHPFFS